MARSRPLELDPAAFRAAGHRLVDQLADFLSTLGARDVVPQGPSAALRDVVGQSGVPERGTPAPELLDAAARLVIEHSLLNGHPRFFGYITSSAAPIGALADLLAAAVNPNCGSWGLSPVATVIEEQTVGWIAELLGMPSSTGGLLVSGGNLANMVCFWTARAAKAKWDLRAGGVAAEDAARLVAYCSAETHTWIQKAADLSGIGTEAIRWVPCDAAQRMDVRALAARIAADRAAGMQPFLVVGTAGTVSTGAVDPLQEIAAICRQHDLWFHVDGAYGAPAVLAPGASDDLLCLGRADSLAVDPHKWMYAPLEAGCALVRDPRALRAAFSYTPAYYHFESDEPGSPPNYYELGPQNSRGFRALKVWLGIRQAGRQGLAASIADDMRLSRELFALVDAHPELEAVTQSLSITTFRYVPPGTDVASPAWRERLNVLNQHVLDRLQRSGRAYVSNALVDGRFVLRACIVNFRTDHEDLVALCDAVVEIGRTV